MPWAIVWQQVWKLQFCPNYKSGKTNRDADALSRIPWEYHDWHIKVESVWAIILNATSGTTMVEVYSCNIQVTDTMNTAHNPKIMSFRDWVVAQSQSHYQGNKVFCE